MPRFGELIVDARHVRLLPAPAGAPTCILEVRLGWFVEILEPHGRVRKRLARAARRAAP